MPFDADPAATHNPTLDDIVPVNWLDLINANFAAIGAAWTPFTPGITFGTSGTFSLGDGTLTGAYIQIGKTLKFRFRLLLGTTTSFGTGDIRVTLPNSLTSISTAQTCGIAHALDAATNNYVGCVQAGSSATYVTFNNDGNINNWAHNSPFTFGSADALTFSAELEVA